MVPLAGIEPARRERREILSLLCLPISPQGPQMALPEGFEPPAPELGIRHSIQLSYGSKLAEGQGFEPWEV